MILRHLILPVILLLSTGLFAQPELQWAIKAGNGGEDYLASQAVDLNGNVYSVGHFTGTVDFDPSPAVFNLTSDGAKDIFISKISSTGSLVWAINIGWGNDDEAKDIAIDPLSGNIVVTGYFMGTVDFNPGTGTNNMSTYSSGSQGAFVLMLDANAGYVWSRRANRYTEGSAVTISSEGSVYVGLNVIDSQIGQNISFDQESSTPSWNQDFFIWKFSSTGNSQWLKDGDAMTEPLSAKCLLAFPNDELVVGLTYSNSANLSDFSGPNFTGDNGDDLLIFKLNSSGVHLWNRVITSVSNVDCRTLHKRDDSSFVLGGGFTGSVNFSPPFPAYSHTTEGSYDGFILAMDIQNEMEFSYSFGGVAEDVVLDISSNSEGDIYVSGRFMETADMDGSANVNHLISGSESDGYILKLNESGEYLWAVGFGPGAQDEVNSINVLNEEVYCGGNFEGAVDFDPGEDSFELTSFASTKDFFSLKLGDSCTPSTLVPLANELETITEECSIELIEAPQATNNCGETINGLPDVTFPLSSPGSITIIWTYDDGNGNTTTQTQEVIIDDVSAPVADLAVLEAITAECEVSTLTAPTASDNCLGEVIGTHDTVLPITSSTSVTWTYDDGNGNTTTQSQEVIIDDVSAPVADLAVLEAITAECEVSTLIAPTATDNCVGEVSGTHDALLPITSSTSVTWTYDDSNGNTTTQSQEVIIDDVSAPVADLAMLEAIIAECEVSALIAPTATDNCVGEVTGIHNADFPITTSTTVTWTYDDGNGNTSSQIQQVIIDDISAPVPDLDELDEVVSECQIDSLIAPTATDNCIGEVLGTPDITFPITETSTLNWAFDDGNGNQSFQSQEVIITAIDNSITQIDANTLEADATGYSYQWLDCDENNEPIDGAIDQSFTATDSGNYGVEISDGTCSVTSDCVSLIVVGIEESVDRAISVFPNPTADFVNIIAPKVIDEMRVMNSIGQVVYEQFNLPELTVRVELPEAPGLYFIFLEFGGEFASVRVLKD